MNTNLRYFLSQNYNLHFEDIQLQNVFKKQQDIQYYTSDIRNYIHGISDGFCDKMLCLFFIHVCRHFSTTLNY